MQCVSHVHYYHLASRLPELACLLVAYALHHFFQPVCLSICSSFSSRGSVDMLRASFFRSCLSRLSCFDCLVVRRRIAQFSWPKMFVLMAAHSISRVLLDAIWSAKEEEWPTIHAIGTQEMRPLDPPTSRAFVQRCDILESFASHKP
jgi:hypothetical protein